MFINFSNHPYAQWSAEHKAAVLQGASAKALGLCTREGACRVVGRAGARIGLPAHISPALMRGSMAA